MPIENLTPEQKHDLILEKVTKTERYMRWQLYITIALVVVPVIAVLVILPMVFSAISEVSNIYLQ